MNAPGEPLLRARPRTLALDVAAGLRARVDDGRLGPGSKLPTENQLMGEFGVSRTVVREALSQLQAAGVVLTRHGIGTFVAPPAEDAPFRIAPEQLETLRDVIAVLELRIGIETEAAGLAAQRRTAQNLSAMRAAIDDFARAVAEGRDSVGADFRLHGEIARATQNAHFSGLLSAFGPKIIPRARLGGQADAAGAGDRAAASGAQPADAALREYLRGVNAEHENIFDAIVARDADAARAAMRTHLSNSRERRVRAAEGAAAGATASSGPDIRP